MVPVLANLVASQQPALVQAASSSSHPVRPEDRGWRHRSRGALMPHTANLALTQWKEANDVPTGRGQRAMFDPNRLERLGFADFANAT